MSVCLSRLPGMIDSVERTLDFAKHVLVLMASLFSAFSHSIHPMSRLDGLADGSRSQRPRTFVLHQHPLSPDLELIMVIATCHHHQGKKNMRFHKRAYLAPGAQRASPVPAVAFTSERGARTPFLLFLAVHLPRSMTASSLLPLRTVWP